MIHFFYTPYIFRKNSYEIYETAQEEIVKAAVKCLGKYMPIGTHDCRAGRVTENPSDILIGHVTYSYKETSPLYNWVKENSLCKDSIGHPNTYLIFPGTPYPIDLIDTKVTPYYLEQISVARLCFILCGYDVWVKGLETIRNSDDCSKRIHNKFVRLNMGCDSRLFKYKLPSICKRSKNLIHISNLRNYKNPMLLVRSLEKSDAKCTVASSAVVSDVLLKRFQQNKNISFVGCINNSLATTEWIIHNYDFYIHTSRFMVESGGRECQATTILENAARGLVPIITRDSGFNSEYAIYLTEDAEQNAKIINSAINMSDDEYWERSFGVRKQVKKYHNWESIYERLYEAVKLDMMGLPIEDRSGGRFS